MPIEHADTCNDNIISNASCLPSGIGIGMKPPANEIRPLSDSDIEQTLHRAYTENQMRICVSGCTYVKASELCHRLIHRIHLLRLQVSIYTTDSDFRKFRTASLQAAFFRPRDISNMRRSRRCSLASRRHIFTARVASEPIGCLLSSIGIGMKPPANEIRPLSDSDIEQSLHRAYTENQMRICVSGCTYVKASELCHRLIHRIHLQRPQVYI
jgi:hypothetical protein